MPVITELIAYICLLKYFLGILLSLLMKTALTTAFCCYGNTSATGPTANKWSATLMLAAMLKRLLDPSRKTSLIVNRFDKSIR